MAGTDAVGEDWGSGTATGTAVTAVVLGAVAVCSATTPISLFDWVVESEGVEGMVESENVFSDDEVIGGAGSGRTTFSARLGRLITLTAWGG